MSILIIGIMVLLAIFIIGYKYTKTIKSKKEDNTDNLEDGPCLIDTVSSEIKKKEELTSLEKSTAIKTLEKMGYTKLEIIQLLGEDIYDN